MFPRLVLALLLLTLFPAEALAAAPGVLVTPEDFQKEPVVVRATFEAVFGSQAAEAWAAEHNYQVVAANGRTFAQELAENGGARHFLGVYKKPWLAAKAWVEEVARTTPPQPVWPASQEGAAKTFGTASSRSGNPDQWERCPGEEVCWHLKDGPVTIVNVPAGMWFEGWDGKKKLGPADGPKQLFAAGITIRPGSKP